LAVTTQGVRNCTIRHVQGTSIATTVANARSPSRWAVSSVEKMSVLNAISLKPDPVARGTVMPQCQPPSCWNTWRAGGAWASAGEEVVMACSPVMGRLQGNYIGREPSLRALLLRRNIQDSRKCHCMNRHNFEIEICTVGDGWHIDMTIVVLRRLHGSQFACVGWGAA
jgi:hypothetical protein